jgi:hypothetical protein
VGGRRPNRNLSPSISPAAKRFLAIRGPCTINNSACVSYKESSENPPLMADIRFSNLIEETTENSLFVHVK